METTPGRGWTIFQRRVDGSEDFYRNWTDYKTGFGNLSGEFWLGLDKIHRLSTSEQNVILRVDLESFENETAYAIYESFSVRNESEAYILNFGNYSGTNKYSYKVLECMFTEIIPSIISVGNESEAYILNVGDCSGNNKYIDINSLHACIGKNNSQTR
jgi:hypothetical protein